LKGEKNTVFFFCTGWRRCIVGVLAIICNRYERTIGYDGVDRITCHCLRSNLPYIIVRPTNNYGIGQYVEKLIPKSCKYLKLGKKIPLHNNGDPIRNWLHAKDTADAVVTIIESGVENEIYNICGGFEQSNKVTAEKIIKEYFGNTTYSSYINTDYKRQGQDVRYALDDSKLRSLGWEPKAIFDEELKDIIQYYKNKFIW
jgi:dTDP-glucose 4,6-dehydratase